MEKKLIGQHLDVYLCHSFSPANSSLSAINNGSGIYSFNDCQVYDCGKYIQIFHADDQPRKANFDLVPWGNVACIENA